MKISQVVGPRLSRVVEAPDPTPQPGHVIVDVLACGICTSDLPPWREWGSEDKPVLLGHEIVGRVRWAGPTSAFTVGDVVTGLADGGFATQATMNEHWIVRVPEGIEPGLCLGEPFADLVGAIDAVGPTALGASTTGAAKAGHERIAVVGAGFMGLGLIQLARLRAPEVLIAVDPSPAARQRALELGADLAFAPDDLPAELLNGPTGEGTGTTPDARMDLVLEAAGHASALELGIQLARPFGTLSIVGYHHYTQALSLPMDAWHKALVVRAGFTPNQDRLMAYLVKAVDLIGQRRITQAPLITHRFGLDGIDEAYRLMESRTDSFVKSIMVP
ncbi:MAG: alcohol dehydrogenase catalytic domain-containing protein [Propionibacteriaceae bacterium]|jgi:threonine dehydrogenase-like Zn-dependent dehydrogenase|nr:alcohol dehydrogenase catalytic domain-containing protein [Propionibacteriaceae bacterium]